MTHEDGRMGLPSASKAERWTNCVGSVQLEELIPDAEQGPEARRGDRIHFALADGKVNDLPNADEVECAELLQEMEKKAVEAFRLEVKAVDESFNGKLTACREQRLVFKRGETPLMTGKPDLVLWTETLVKRGLIVDYKTGMGIVPTEKSHQLRVLAFLAADEYGLEEVYVTILQPNNPIVLQKMTRSEIRLERERTLLALDRIADKSASRQVGPWCQYCKATGICPEAQEATKTLTTTSTSAVIDPSQLPRLLEVCTLAESVIENVRKRAREILDAGGEVPGWKLINSKRRSITSSASAYHLIKEAFGEEVAMGASSVSLTDATKSLATKAGLKEKEAKAKIESVLADIIEMKNSQRLMRS
jgi:hypothetical protein